MSLEATLLVYAGAAPGNHLAFLCRLFPEIQALFIKMAMTIATMTTIAIRNMTATPITRVINNNQQQ